MIMAEQSNIEFSVFNDCHAYDFGGAVSIYNCECDCVLYCVCSNNCYTTSSGLTWGQFIRTNVENKERLNYINISSVCLSNSNGYKTLDINYGKQCCTSLNISNNNIKSYSTISLYYSTYASYITYCSINSNSASNGCCISLSNSGSNNIDTCNIINNVGSYTISCGSKTTIQNCCILNNNGSPLFSGTSYITIYDSCVDRSLSGITVKNVTTDSNNNNLKFTSTAEYCYSDIDQVGKLTPIPDEPIKIKENTISKNLQIIEIKNIILALLLNK